jgi:hypothetical protein
VRQISPSGDVGNNKHVVAWKETKKVDDGNERALKFIFVIGIGQDTTEVLYDR